MQQLHELQKYKEFYSDAKKFEQTYKLQKKMETSSWVLFPTTINIPLQGNSANAKFCFWDSKNNDQFVIKVQVDLKSTDNILNDIVMNRYINEYMRSKFDLKLQPSIADHFMTIVGSFIGQVSLNTSTYYGSQNNNSIKKPCIIMTRVHNPISLFDLGIDVLVELQVTGSTYGLDMCRLFRAMLRIGESIGFAHNDLHTANILYDYKQRTFVLIDYGRVHIPLPRSNVKLSADVLARNRFEEIVAQTNDVFKELNMSYDTSYTSFSAVFKPYNKDVHGMYAMNDIAGFCWMVYMNTKQIRSGMVSMQTKPMSEMITLIDTTILRTDFATLDFTKLDLFKLLNTLTDFQLMLIVGVVWMQRVLFVFDKVSASLYGRGKKVELTFVDNHYCIIDPKAFALIEKPLQEFWRKYYSGFVFVWHKVIAMKEKNIKLQMGGVTNIAINTQDRISRDEEDKKLMSFLIRNEEMKKKIKEHSSKLQAQNAMHTTSKKVDDICDLFPLLCQPIPNKDLKKMMNETVNANCALHKNTGRPQEVPSPSITHGWIP
jgi:hypothetical protein